ncbi:Chemotaxis protein CheA [Gemmata obscuriglobus]|uniref:histidine kinase n=1 Tax=Gemmata obscuriglobus TaxID=114 RepID=A0A2Z3GY21_9BACT|nr:chemotaxis protein CheA [Gemmata obscuriglobus]AWM36397.1 chemotaxis protein CheA [Gemmata obscuriglobus]QEG30988.1 Chemotaxis protein CheA [Gemmata obscuriglobus]VTS10323.1 chemotaxis protein : Histidine kinase OS=Melioribacter roseus (strain JCM 17771 / P3M-2) GN=MROS_2123 PE=4 SV=1: Hpt: H-kinase_dim: HATPase_c: CheW [Gemmata obscuriglobus UQM 2246]
MTPVPDGNELLPLADPVEPVSGFAERVGALARNVLRLEDGTDPGAAAAAAGDARWLADALAGDAPSAARLAALLASVTGDVRDARVGCDPGLAEALLTASDALAGAPEDRDRALAALQDARARAPAPRPAVTSAGWPNPGGPVAADALAQFTAEALESLSEAEAALLDLETGTDPADAVRRLFRAVHSIKGTADYLGLAQIRALSHKLENVLELARSGGAALDAPAAELVLQGVDHLKAMVAALTPAGEVARDMNAFAAALDAQSARGATEPAPGAPLDALAEELKAAANGSREGLARVRAAAAALPAEPAGELLALLDHLSAARERLVAAFEPDEPEPVLVAPPPQQQPAAAPPPAANLVPKAAPPDPAAGANKAAPAAKTMRVDQRKLDEYVNLAGELVIARNALVHAHRCFQTDRAARAVLKDAIDKVCRIVGDVQNNAMAMRMVPVGTIFQRFPRLVRDVAKSLAKQIELRLEGEDTELDKQVAEALSDPLVHLVRNAADHGIEAPDRRAAAGKPVAGTVTLRAGREGNAIVIDVQDDGGGIDPERVKAKAVAMGVLTADQAAALSREQALQLIFAPGLSTAAVVSDLSGRGVGMDVVKSNIAALGGAVTVHSQPGAGTRVRLTLPLTLAVTTVVLVESGGTLFGVPIDAVQETLKVEPDGFRQLRGVRAVSLRGAVTPVKSLAALIGLDAPEAAGPRDRVPVVVLNVAGARFGVAVDSFRGQQEIVLKPVPPLLGHLEGVGGATIMGDGGVVLILDPMGLYRLALDDRDGPGHHTRALTSALSSLEAVGH